MIRDQFFEDVKSGAYQLTDEGLFMKFWDGVVTFENETGLSLDTDLNREQYVSLMNYMHIRHASMFPNYKRALILYLRYLIQNGALSAAQDEIAASMTFKDVNVRNEDKPHYYKNLSVLREAIEITALDGQRYDPSVYDVPSAYLYLAWFGFTEEQIVNIKKIDVSEEGVMLNGKLIEMPFFVTSLLVRLRDAEGYYQQARGIIFRKYVYSDYLLRSERADRFTIENARSVVYRMNNINDKKYSLRYDVAHLSGIFYRAYMKECESTSLNLDDPQVASELLCEDLSDKVRRTNRVRDYQHFKKLFASN